jgi:uncharacterized protein (DUF2062 family)
MSEISDPANGRRILLSLIVAVLIADALASSAHLATMLDPLDTFEGQVAVVKRVGRFLVTLLLMMMVYRGNGIAVVICILLFGLTALIAIPATIENPLMMPLLVLFCLFPGVLLLSNDVSDFLELQRSGRGHLINERNR